MAIRRCLSFGGCPRELKTRDYDFIHDNDGDGGASLLREAIAVEPGNKAKIVTRRICRFKMPNLDM
jgi:hypothetical protein